MPRVRTAGACAKRVDDTFEAASAHELIAPAEARRLIEARALYSELLQRERLRSTEATPSHWNEAATLSVMARHLRFGSSKALLRAVEAQRGKVAAIYERIMQGG